MTDFRPGQFVRFAAPESNTAKVGLLVSHDSYVPSTPTAFKLVTPERSLPLDAFKKFGGKVLEILPSDHSDSRSLVWRFIVTESFIYGADLVRNTRAIDDCLVAYVGNHFSVKVLPLRPDVTIKKRNALHAMFSMKRSKALPPDFRLPRASGFGQGDFVRHERFGRGVHLGSSVLLERPFRIWPTSDQDTRYADWIVASEVDKSGVLSASTEADMAFDRSPERYPEPGRPNQRNSFDLPHDWENGRSYCPTCGSDSLRFRNLESFGIMRHCYECTWANLIPCSRMPLRDILAMEQEFRINSLLS